MGTSLEQECKALRRFLAVPAGYVHVKPVRSVPFGNGNLRGAFVPEDMEVLVVCKDPSCLTPDECLALAHEMYHVCQYAEGRLPEGYREREDASGTEDYAMQDAEVEASGFAAAWLMSVHHVRPMFIGYSDALREKIMQEGQKWLSD